MMRFSCEINFRLVQAAAVKMSLMIFSLIALLSDLAYGQNYRFRERTKFQVEEQAGDLVILKISSSFEVPITVKLNLTLENLDSDTTQVSAIIPPKADGVPIGKFKRSKSKRDFKLIYSWWMTLGDTSSVHDHSYLYSFPYVAGQQFRVSQGPNGSFSHQNSFAYDFAMPVGSAVMAAREGIVAAVKYNSNTGGPDKAYIDECNFITILHPDGTIANYLHLRNDGVLVKEGQTVHRGQMIGFSGDTGYSTGPHLHFEIISPDINSEGVKFMAFEWEPRSYEIFPGMRKTYASNYFRYKPKIENKPGKVPTKTDQGKFRLLIARVQNMFSLLLTAFGG